MEEFFTHTARHKLVLPHRMDRRVCTELEDRMCDLFLREEMTHTHIREIMQDLDMLSIWCTLPWDMTSLMYHVFGALNLIWRFRNHSQSTSSSKDDAPSSPPHDSPSLSHSIK